MFFLPFLNKAKPYAKLSYQVILHLIFFASFFIYPIEYNLWGLLFYVLFGGIGISVTFHRYYSHLSYRYFPEWMKWIGLTFGTLASQGTIIEWVMKHRKHHKKSDTEEDPHSPHFCNPFRLYWTALKYETNISVHYGGRLLKDRLALGFHKYYWHIIGIYAAFLLMLGPQYFVYGYVVPAVWSWIATSLGIGILGHLYGYTSYDTKDLSRNNTLIGLLVFGEGYQNNHHQFPGDAVHSKKWYEIDILGVVSKKLFN